MECDLTSGSLLNMTTRPPLSPVANSSPSWLNSTVEMMSAETDTQHDRLNRLNGWSQPPRRFHIESPCGTLGPIRSVAISKNNGVSSNFANYTLLLPSTFIRFSRYLNLISAPANAISLTSDTDVGKKIQLAVIVQRSCL